MNDKNNNKIIEMRRDVIIKTKTKKIKIAESKSSTTSRQFFFNFFSVPNNFQISQVITKPKFQVSSYQISLRS